MLFKKAEEAEEIEDIHGFKIGETVNLIYRASGIDANFIIIERLNPGGSTDYKLIDSEGNPPRSGRYRDNGQFHYSYIKKIKHK